MACDAAAATAASDGCAFRAPTAASAPPAAHAAARCAPPPRHTIAASVRHATAVTDALNAAARSTATTADASSASSARRRAASAPPALRRPAEPFCRQRREPRGVQPSAQSSLWQSLWLSLSSPSRRSAFQAAIAAASRVARFSRVCASGRPVSGLVGGLARGEQANHSVIADRSYTWPSAEAGTVGASARGRRMRVAATHARWWFQRMLAAGFASGRNTAERMTRTGDDWLAHDGVQDGAHELPGRRIARHGRHSSELERAAEWRNGRCGDDSDPLTCGHVSFEPSRDPNRRVSQFTSLPSRNMAARRVTLPACLPAAKLTSQAGKTPAGSACAM